MGYQTGHDGDRLGMGTGQAHGHVILSHLQLSCTGEGFDVRLRLVAKGGVTALASDVILAAGLLPTVRTGEPRRGLAFWQVPPERRDQPAHGWRTPGAGEAVLVRTTP